MRTTFIRTLEEIAAADETVFLLSADLGFRLFDDFRAKYPTRFLNVGVAESNMIGVSAGMALCGKNVFCYSMVPFLIMRALEQIRVDICYQNLNVKLIGVGGGLTYGFEGMTHHGLEDLSIMRSIPNMTVVVPSDPVEAKGIFRESASYPGPLYIRLAGNNDPVIHENEPPVQIGKGIIVTKGSDIAIISAGTVLFCARKAVETLRSHGFEVTLISMHTVKPLDEEMLLEQANKHSAIFSVEEHSLIGGLGSAISEVLMENRYKGIFKRIALPDQYGAAVGSGKYLRKIYGLTPEGISQFILDELMNKGELK